MKNLNCDVLVVGAGPAGSMTAKTVAQRGLDVIVVERNSEIGYPVRCGEGLNKFFFEDTKIKKDNSFLQQKIDKTKIYFYNEIYELKTDRWKGYTIDRRIFDKYLASLAQEKGAKILTNTKAISLEGKKEKKIVTCKTNNDLIKIESRVVVGAGGFECRVGEWIKITQPWKLDDFSKCLEYYSNNLKLEESNVFHIAFGEEFPFGYGWIFPKSENLANIGVGAHPKTNTKNALNFFLKDYPTIRETLGTKFEIIETRAGGIPVCGPKKIDEVVSDGVLLVGDAAGIVDPITGEGVTPSILSGIAAGEAINLSIESGSCRKKDLEVYYPMWRNKRYAGGLKLGEDLDNLTRIKADFFRIFNNKSIPTKARKEVMDAFISEDQEELVNIIKGINKYIPIFSKNQQY